MKTLQQLVDPDPAWPLVRSWVEAAGDRVVVLPCVPEDGERTLLALQVSTQSTMGSLALHSGGMLVDHGWLRLLGAGHPRILGNLRDWNHLGAESLPGLERVPGALVVAHDALGGIFVLNGGGLEGPLGNVNYLAPDAAEWEDTDLGHSAFVHWALDGHLSGFYGDDRWPGFEEDVSVLQPHQAFMHSPPLWAPSDGGRRRRTVAPMRDVLAALWSELRSRQVPAARKH